jgi:hypothetical protein
MDAYAAGALLVALLVVAVPLIRYLRGERPRRFPEDEMWRRFADRDKERGTLTSGVAVALLAVLAFGVATVAVALRVLAYTAARLLGV